MNIILICLALRYQGDWDKIYQALEAKEKVTIEEIKKVEQQMQKDNLEIITILDSNYPAQLKQAYKPPFVLWLKGNKSLLSKKMICFTGNQKSKLIEQRVVDFVPELIKRYTLINPHFQGIDQEIEAVWASPKIHISASGNDLSNFIFKKGDLMISEYPDGAKPARDKFRNRNRLIAAFSQSLILVSSLRDGPINHLVSAFLNLGKEIYCFPGNGLADDGNSELIKQGANLITTINDLNH